MKDYPYMYGQLKVAAQTLARTAKDAVQYESKFMDQTGVYEKLLNSQANTILELLEKHETPNR